MSAAEVTVLGPWGMFPWDLLLVMLLRAKLFADSAARTCVHDAFVRMFVWGLASSCSL